MKARVQVRLKNGVLDPQGEAARLALGGLGFDGVGTVRQGKMFEIELEDTDPVAAKARLTEMAEKLLANTVIESYEIELL